MKTNYYNPLCYTITTTDKDFDTPNKAIKSSIFLSI